MVAEQVLYLGSNDAAAARRVRALRHAGVATARVRQSSEALAACRLALVPVVVFAAHPRPRGALQIVRELSGCGAAVIVVADDGWGRMAIRHGAWDTVRRDEHDAGDLCRAVKRALAIRRLERECDELRRAHAAAGGDTASRTPLLGDETIAALAHDITNPLAAILGYSQILAEPDATDGPLGEIATRLQANAQAVLDRVADVFDALRAQHGRLALQRAATDFNRLVGEVVGEAGGRARGRVEFRPAPSLPALVLDQRRMTRVLDGLLAAAVAGAPPDGVVRVTTAREGNHIVLRVGSAGAGLPPGAARANGGGAVGAAEVMRSALARVIVAAHGGAVRMHGAPGGGLAVTLQLPIAGTQVAVGQ